MSNNDENIVGFISKECDKSISLHDILEYFKQNLD